MSARPISRNNLLAGVFVIFSLLLAVFIAVAVSGAQKLLIPTHAYTIRFTLADGAAGLKVGSLVNVGGVEAGRVIGIDYERPSPGAMPTGVNVRVLVRQSVTLYEDAAAFLERPLLGSMGSINVIRAAKADAPGTPLPPGSLLHGMIAPPSFLAQAGFGPEQSRQVQNLFAKASDVVDRVDRMSSKLETELDPTLTAFRQAREDVTSVTKLARERSPLWAEQVDKFLATAQQAASDASRAIRDIQAGIDTNRPVLDRSMANVEAITRDVRETSVPTLNAALKSGQTGADEFRAAVGDVAALIREQEPNLRRALANFRLASDQAKLTMVEVRRSPWRLLYSPGTKELESELFYDAARTYAEAVSDLRAASESLEMLTTDHPGRGAALGVDRETIGELTGRLAKSFERYNEAEKALLKKMEERKP